VGRPLTASGGLRQHPTGRVAFEGRPSYRGWCITRTEVASQYLSIRSTERLAEAGAVTSVGSRGDSFDNAVTESFFAILECELLDRTRFATRTQARTAVFDYLEGFYNRIRRHSTLGYLSPAEYERKHPTGYLLPDPASPKVSTGPTLLANSRSL
jgi:putative transposase